MIDKPVTTQSQKKTPPPPGPFFRLLFFLFFHVVEYDLEKRTQIRPTPIISIPPSVPNESKYPHTPPSSLPYESNWYSSELQLLLDCAKKELFPLNTLTQYQICNFF